LPLILTNGQKYNKFKNEGYENPIFKKKIMEKEITF